MPSPHSHTLFDSLLRLTHTQYVHHLARLLNLADNICFMVGLDMKPQDLTGEPTMGVVPKVHQNQRIHHAKEFASREWPVVLMQAHCQLLQQQPSQQPRLHQRPLLAPVAEGPGALQPQPAR